MQNPALPWNDPDVVLPESSMKPEIEVWHCGERSHPYPWRYAVSFGVRRYVFAGIPNQCESIAVALTLAHARAAWLQDGSFEERYQ